MARAFKYISSHILYLIIIYIILSHRSGNVIVSYTKINRFLVDIKHILLWNKIHGFKEMGQKQFIDRNCRFINCYFTMNRTFFNDTRYFDAIVFNLQDVAKVNQGLPKVRGNEQKFIFAANDSADNYPICSSIYENYFNWTWTYRAESTVPYRFISVYNLEHEELGSHFLWPALMKPIDKALKKDLSSKCKAVAWFIDNCGKTRSQRESFVKELQVELAKFNLTVDLFGKCGTYKCQRRSSAACFSKIRKFYYFYLALEDSIARDYVTAKVVPAYMNNVVPIVYGGAKYNHFLPPNSYLNGKELGVEVLAKTIYATMENAQVYHEYFNWRNHFIIKESPILDVCSLCEKLNSPNYLRHRVKLTDFRKWWNPEYESRCGRNSLSLANMFK